MAYTHGDTLIIFFLTSVESIDKTSSATSIGDDKVLISPFLTENLSEDEMVSDNGDVIVGVV